MGLKAAPPEKTGENPAQSRYRNSRIAGRRAGLLHERWRGPQLKRWTLRPAGSFCALLPWQKGAFVLAAGIYELAKEQNMEKEELLMDYCNAIYQNINSGLQAIEDILPKIQDDGFKNVVAQIQDKYYSLSKECEIYAKSEDIKGIKDNSWLEKVRMWMSVNMSTMSDKSNRKIAELLLIGSFMGYLTCIKDQADHKDISSELDEILEKLKAFQKSNIETLIPYLN